MSNRFQPQRPACPLPADAVTRHSWRPPPLSCLALPDPPNNLAAAGVNPACLTACLLQRLPASEDPHAAAYVGMPLHAQQQQQRTRSTCTEPVSFVPV